MSKIPLAIIAIMRAAPLPSQKTDQTSTVPVEFCTKLHNSPVVSDLAPLVVLIPVLHKKYMQLWQIGNQGFFFKKKWTNGQACFWTTSCGAYFPLRPIKWLMRSGLDCLLLITIIQPARSLSFLCQVVQAPKHLLIYLSLPQERREEDGRRGGAHRPLGRRRRRRCGNVHGCDELPHRGLRRAPAWIRHQCYRSVHWCRCWS